MTDNPDRPSPLDMAHRLPACCRDAEQPPCPQHRTVARMRERDARGKLLPVPASHRAAARRRAARAARDAEAPGEPQ
jgi:hypothetical protein